MGHSDMVDIITQQPDIDHNVKTEESYVIELGRRIEYDYDKFGDSPACMDKSGLDIISKTATVQGKGVTETEKWDLYWRPM